MDTDLEADGRSGLLKGLFYLVTILLLTALGFSGWVIVLHWGRVGV